MSHLACVAFASALLLLTACSIGAAQPQLLLGVVVATHARREPELRERRQRYAFTAALAVHTEARAERATEPWSALSPELDWWGPLAEDPCEPNRDALCEWALSAEEQAWSIVAAQRELP